MHSHLARPLHAIAASPTWYHLAAHDVSKKITLFASSSGSLTPFHSTLPARTSLQDALNLSFFLKLTGSHCERSRSSFLTQELCFFDEKYSQWLSFSHGTCCECDVNFAATDLGVSLIRLTITVAKNQENRLSKYALR
jgi:hypothetical protein